jgi:protein SCO1/2
VTRRSLIALTALVAALAGARPAHAQGFTGKPPEQGEQPTRELKVEFEQRLGAQVPIDTPFRSESGSRTTLRECMNGRPTILVLAYLHCPHMCGEVQQGVLAAARAMPDYHIGRDFNVVVVSFDPKDTHLMAAAQRDFFVKHYGRPGAADGLRFLTGEKRSIEELVTAVGFRFEFDKAAKEYAHASGIMVVTPEGKISKYFYGTVYVDKDEMGAPTDPPTANDLKAALVEAGGGKIGTPVEKFLQMCSRLLHVNEDQKYLMMVVRGAGALTVLVLVGGVIYMLRRERRRPAAGAPPAAVPAEQPAGGV